MVVWIVLAVNSSTQCIKSDFLKVLLCSMLTGAYLCSTSFLIHCMTFTSSFYEKKIFKNYRWCILPYAIKWLVQWVLRLLGREYYYMLSTSYIAWFLSSYPGSNFYPPKIIINWWQMLLMIVFFIVTKLVTLLFERRLSLWRFGSQGQGKPTVFISALSAQYFINHLLDN